MLSTKAPASARIKKLPPLLINQLAAGEIVTRPASVVKELLENAIDAGATEIEIRVTQGGMGLIEVRDNGCGIHPDDMVMAVTRHATSKIADVANLQGIRTLGFRGEALASTAAVSRLTLTSSHDDSGIGRQLTVAGILEDTPTLAPIVHPQGTTVLVKDLYFNVPARRGNLKSIATEFAHIESVVREVALVYADVGLTLYHDQKKRLALPVGAGPSQAANESQCSPWHSLAPSTRLPLTRLQQALGSRLEAQSLPLFVDLAGLMTHNFDGCAAEDASDNSENNALRKDSANSEHLSDAGFPDHSEDTNSHLHRQNLSSEPLLWPHIEGWLWFHSDTHHNTSAQSLASQGQTAALPKLIYVNGRLIKEPLIANQIRQALQSVPLATAGYALYFHLPAYWLNLNVHPSKQRIKIHALANIMAHLNYAIKSKLGTIKLQSQPNLESVVNQTAAFQVAEALDNYQVDPTTQVEDSDTLPIPPQCSIATADPDLANASLKKTSLENAACKKLSISSVHAADTHARVASEAGAGGRERLGWQAQEQLPLLLTVIEDGAKTAPLGTQPMLATDLDKQPLVEKQLGPWLLLFGRNKHFLISASKFLWLLQPEQQPRSQASIWQNLTQMTAVQIAQIGKSLMQSYLDSEQNIDILYALISKHSYSQLPLQQLLSWLVSIDTDTKQQVTPQQADAISNQKDTNE